MSTAALWLERMRRGAPHGYVESILTLFFVAAQVGVSMPPLAAVVFSITSFHGRGFMPSESVLLTNPLTVLAAGEAIIGLLIEITFIATFTQRFFAR